MPIPTTPSARFARDATAGAKAQVWVEEVIKQRLPGGDFAAAFRDGQGLCHLVNAFQPGTISKVETSTSPFKQMANISAFIQACRTLGVREHALFETLVSTYCCWKPRPQRAKALYTHDPICGQPANHQIKPADPAQDMFSIFRCCCEPGIMTYPRIQYAVCANDVQ